MTAPVRGLALLPTLLLLTACTFPVGDPVEAVIVGTVDGALGSCATVVETPDRTRLLGPRCPWGEVGDTLRVQVIRIPGLFEAPDYVWKPARPGGGP